MNHVRILIITIALGFGSCVWAATQLDVETSVILKADGSGAVTVTISGDQARTEGLSNKKQVKGTFEPWIDRDGRSGVRRTFVFDSFETFLREQKLPYLRLRMIESGIYELRVNGVPRKFERPARASYDVDGGSHGLGALMGNYLQSAFDDGLAAVGRAAFGRTTLGFQFEGPGEVLEAVGTMNGAKVKWERKLAGVGNLGLLQVLRKGEGMPVVRFRWEDGPELTGPIPEIGGDVEPVWPDFRVSIVAESADSPVVAVHVQDARLKRTAKVGGPAENRLEVSLLFVWRHPTLIPWRISELGLTDAGGDWGEVNENRSGLTPIWRKQKDGAYAAAIRLERYFEDGESLRGAYAKIRNWGGELLIEAGVDPWLQKLSFDRPGAWLVVAKEGSLKLEAQERDDEEPENAVQLRLADDVVLRYKDLGWGFSSYDGWGMSAHSEKRRRHPYAFEQLLTAKSQQLDIRLPRVAEQRFRYRLELPAVDLP